MTLGPLRLLPSFREKIWGSTTLEPWFENRSEKTGEVWFTFDGAETDAGATLAELMRSYGAALLGRAWREPRFPILVKFLFTSERLSIQVHPDDARARAWEGSAGKTEMWHLLRAAPDATLALGFSEPIGRERLREASLSGEIERLVRWFPARAGETYFAGAGTVHAIGGGLALCEIQQNSDVTYRLYDYGRPRELHLDRGVAVAALEPHPGPVAPIELGGGRRLLASCPYFRTESWDLDGAVEYTPDPERVHVLIFLEGEGTAAGRPFASGQVWLVPAAAKPFALDPRGSVRLLRTFVP